MTTHKGFKKVQHLLGILNIKVSLLLGKTFTSDDEILVYIMLHMARFYTTILLKQRVMSAL